MTSSESGQVAMMFGLFLFSGCVFIMALYWMRMQEIEALGLLGQAFYEQQYEEAMERFTFAAGGAAFGFSILLIGVAEYIGGALKEVAGTD